MRQYGGMLWTIAWIGAVLLAVLIAMAAGPPGRIARLGLEKRFARRGNLSRHDDYGPVWRG